MYGSFDEAIKDMFSEQEGDHIDNRVNPPDDGVLLQVGGEGVGEGDYAKLVIEKRSIVGIVESTGRSDKKRKASDNSGIGNYQQRNQKKSSSEDVIVIDD